MSERNDGMLAFRLTGLPDSRLPLYLYCVGTHEEKPQLRPDGFPVYQLFLSRTGMGKLKIPGKGVWSVNAAQMFVIEPGVAYEHMPHSKSGWELGYIGIGGESVESVLHAVGLLPSEPRNLKDMEQFWSRMTDIWHAPDQGHTDGWNNSALIYQLILDIARCIGSHEEAGSLEVSSSSVIAAERENDPGSEAFARAIELMHVHYQEDLLLKHVAEAVGYSVQHLNRLFHQKHGVTGHQYMQQLRLQKASQWLQDHPQSSVKEAAEMIGMEVNYFIRMFKREFGETPGKEIKQRNQLKANQDSLH
ncbi:AraC family transcriptional regulator [Paenibacillus sp. ACRSA]|uniref:AraC family transcriptional regulator n=1 Tax=Paenibacillus sp. ACRSA TaxID=2918211 RepID=UPI001EF403C0|nr:AraC family transcriptional regulator [Paenibacillus sp. ACRSA]MCG7377985.1 AraC family transcriptional regulator [Paenibacillus sp. ACRSA]